MMTFIMGHSAAGRRHAEHVAAQGKPAVRLGKSIGTINALSAHDQPLRQTQALVATPQAEVGDIVMATQDREQKLRAYAERRRARGMYDKPKKIISATETHGRH